MRRSLAEELGISSISQAMRHTDLKLAFSHEFLRREDGWPGLQKKYRTKLLARGIEHGLAYQALKEGNIDLTDAYSTDGELNRYDLTILRDDRNYFPHYFAVPFVRLDLPGKARAALLELGSSLDEDSMQKLNEAVVFQGLSFSQVASGFLSSDIRTPLQDVLPNGAEKELPRASNDDSEQLGTVSTPTGTEYDASLHRTEILYDILGNTATHLKLTGIALFASVTTGIVHWRLKKNVVVLGVEHRFVDSVTFLKLTLNLCFQVP
jgi:hypothetical protein